MRDATFYASSLLELHKLEDVTERRASWRQTMAALARATAEDGPGPLEGLRPEALLAGVRVALQDGLVDDLDWLAPAAAGSALYELASVLPLGGEQRELGRRVLARLVGADAATFVAIARRMALGTGKGLGSPGIRARVALVTELPIALGIGDGPLALAIASRRDLARDWIVGPSTGSLASRRLAARLLERAAREAARKASYGDAYNLRVFQSDAVAGAWARLLADRESLVWRHVAVARGLLAPWSPKRATSIEEALAPTLSPTEWRRAAASVSAWAAVAPEVALPLARRAVAQGIVKRDPGIASAFVWGLPRCAESEREAAEELLSLALEHAQPDFGEAVVDLRDDLGPSPLVERATQHALRIIGKRSMGTGDDGAEALSREVYRDLEKSSAGASGRDDEPLRDQIARALQAFASTGAKEAHALARDALAAAQGSLFALEAVSMDEEGQDGKGGSTARRTSLAVLRDLDISLLERDVLAHLLLLGGGADAARAAEEALDPLHDRMADWILARESAPLRGETVASPAHPVLTLRRLRALLHLVDSDTGDAETDPQRASRLRARWFRIARALIDRFERDPPSPVRRTLVAALARAMDALVRVGACDVVDALLVVAKRAVEPAELATLAEASMDPDLVHVLERYAAFAEAVDAGAGAAMPAFETLTREIAPDTSGRIEALRTALVRVCSSLGLLAGAMSLRELAPQAGTQPEALTSLEAALSSIAHLGIGAAGRFDPDRPSSGPPPVNRALSVAVTRVLTGADPLLGDHVMSAALDDLLLGVPSAVGKVVAAQLWRLAELPVEGSKPPSTTSMRVPEALPAWLPARRTLGGFYVLRALGAGGVGSVFVVTRIEDKGDEHAERLALKVPEYSASAARTLTEAEFLNLFREEASALIALPQHTNLARFVTFDAGSKPKPILVMELVEGVTLEQLLETRGLDANRAVGVLDDVLAGLDAMHGSGIAHLDIKPSNVVLRGAEEAVLVDFGLAGKHIRPGCATGAYGAPEVWGELEGVKPSPPKVDVYAFGCVAFETLTGRVLFDSDSEMAQITSHMQHDGFPPRLKALTKRPALAPIAELLFSTLRRDPANRPAAADVRRELARLMPQLARLPWPIDAS
ncbi:MAG TPA: serine/threonine-protein kinase [Polyangiaceae bacterium]